MLFCILLTGALAWLSPAQGAIVLLSGEARLSGIVGTYSPPSFVGDQFNLPFDPISQTDITRMVSAPGLPSLPVTNMAQADFSRGELSNGFDFFLRSIATPDRYAPDGLTYAAATTSFKIEFALDTRSQLHIDLDAARGGLTSETNPSGFGFSANITLEKWVIDHWVTEYTSPTGLVDWAGYQTPETMNATPWVPPAFEGSLVNASFDPGIYRLSSTVNRSSLAMALTSGPTIVGVPEPGAALLVLLAAACVKRRRSQRSHPKGTRCV